MKKIISVLLILAMVLSLAACGNGGGGSSKGGEEIGLWGYETIEIDLAKYNEGLDAEMQISEDEAGEFKSFYDMFLAGMYFEFKDDGNGILGYVSEDDTEIEPTEFTYAGGKFTFPEEEDPGFPSYEIKDGKLVIPLEDEDIKGLTLYFKKAESLDEIKSNMDEIMASLEDLFSTMDDEE